MICYVIPFFIQITRGNFRFRVSNSGSLTIQNTRSSDTGHYIGTAINVAGRGSVEFDVSFKGKFGKQSFFFFSQERWGQISRTGRSTSFFFFFWDA